MWDQKVRRLAVEGFKRRPQSPLRRSRARYRNAEETPATTVARPDYDGVGAELKAERERQGRDLAEIARTLHIQQRYLEAIEQGRFDDLPGSTYATGFLRSYGRHLGADPNEVVAVFRRESKLAHGPTKLVVPETFAEPKRPRMTVVLLSLLAAAVLYAGWSYFTTEDTEIPDSVTPAPERLVELLKSDVTPASASAAESAVATDEGAAPVAEAETPAVAEAAAPPAETTESAAATAREAQRDANAVIGPSDAPATAAPVRVAAAPEPSATAVEDADSAEDMPPDTPELASIDPPQASPPVPQPPARPAARDLPTLPPAPPGRGDGDDYEPQRFGGGGSDSRVVVRAKVDSWVQIQAGRNETLLTRILRPGDTFYAPNRRDLMLTTGNVGGLEIIVDGEPLGPLGPLGAVRRNISLDAEKLLALATEAEPAH